MRADSDGRLPPSPPPAGLPGSAASASTPWICSASSTFGGRDHVTDWQVEVNHAIKETGLSFNTDAVLAWPTKTSEVRLFELDNGSMSQARLAREV